MASSSSSSSSSATAAAAGDARPIVLCGPSGVGKSTLLKRLFNQYPDEYGFSVSHTTRAPRPGETPGESYHYVSRAEFEQLIADGAFLEHAEFGGNRYGTTAKAVEAVSQLRTKDGKRRRAVLDIDAQGVRLIKSNHAYLQPFFIFVSPPSFSALQQRLTGRGTETPDSIRRRVGMAAAELGYARSGNAFDAVVVNDDLERAYELLRALVRGERTTGDELPAEEKEAEAAARQALEATA
ncbi:guanylate kinase [Tilletia horrida]|uniref:Guanylate kinase n=1 Tax=Tilletia horrida TaxID=155126 RepID=A0AAN6GER2_9BASI|nr:guanylate kinase [Tilletia horrida]